MKQIIKNIYFLLIVFVMINTISCADYLDVVPEGTATVESAFSMRRHALRYLYTCYSYLPTHHLGTTIDIMGGDEVWIDTSPAYTLGISRTSAYVARGSLSPSNPRGETWSHYYRALRDCNIFLEGLETIKVPDLPEYERRFWEGEAKALKAYYHFLLLRQYGPIPIVKKNLPVSTDVEGVQVARNTIDEVVDYIVEVMDEAIEALPDEVRSESSDLGRITKPIAKSIKAQMLVTAASPLFNCNEEFAPMKNNDGTQLFPQDETMEIEKWKLAAEACLDAVETTMNEQGLELYVYPGDPKYSLTDTIMQQMTNRLSFNEDWNNEVIWADTKAWVSLLQHRVLPVLNPMFDQQPQMAQLFAVPLHVAEQFYSDNGVPIDEDKDWGYGSRYNLRTATLDEGLYILAGGETARINFDREPRFYAWLSFDQGIYYGSGQYDDSKPEQLYHYTWEKEMTGYKIKKWIHYQTLQPVTLEISVYDYIWPKFRLAELLLYTAEALNEAEDSELARLQAMDYLDMVRERAGLEPVKDAWSKYSNRPDKYKTQKGLREIIQRERLIELSFEGSRFWDLRRWKTARRVRNLPIQSWSLFNKENIDIYKPRTIFSPEFGLKDYFWPISTAELNRNANLVQSLEW